MFGRTVIYSSASEVTSSNVLNILKNALQIHKTNSADIEYLYNYYRGDQPILNRVKTIRPEINNKIVENHAYEIVSFKTGYVFGEPIQYVRRGEAVDSDKITQLNDFLFNEDKAGRDKELAEWFYVCGTAYRMVLPGSNTEENPFEIDTLDPRYAFVVYSNGFKKAPIMGVKYIKTDEGNIRYSIYTPTTYFEIENDIIIKEEPHVLGSIPIIEYPANTARLGSFEIVLGLLDALNNSGSNRMDGIEQFVQAFIKFVNCDIDETNFQALKDMGAIKIKGEAGNPADVAIVSDELDQTQVQVQIDYIYQIILIICGMPDRNGASKTTGDTGQAVSLRDGWSAAEARAKDTELVFKKSEKEFLHIVFRILKDSNNINLSLKDIDIKFTRNKADNILTKTQGLQNMLEAGVNPRTAIEVSNLFSDPEQVYIDSQKYLKKWEYAEAKVTPGNNKPNPTGENQ